jgi:hypothetical protein
MPGMIVAGGTGMQRADWRTRAVREEKWLGTASQKARNLQDRQAAVHPLGNGFQSQEPEPGTNNLTGTLGTGQGKGRKRPPAGYEIESEVSPRAAGKARMRRRCTPSIPYRAA